MRTRAYRPEVPGCLEDRALLSGVAGPSADPVVLLHRKFLKVGEQIRLDFQLFARDRVVSVLREDLYNIAVMIPFGRVDGLGVASKRIVDNLGHDLAAHVPHAIRSARDDVLAATRAEVEARVRAGDVVVR